MPFLSRVNIINALTESTSRYLRFLCEQEIGFNKYDADSIVLAQEDPYFLFSVSDTGNLQGNGPFLTDSNRREGRAVLNTTISRTKRHLIIFLDHDYWSHRNYPTLLTELAQRNRIQNNEDEFPSGVQS